MTTPPPWWLEPGPESCPFCEVHIHFEALAWCTECDRPLCQTCLIEASSHHRVLCPDCHAQAGGP